MEEREGGELPWRSRWCRKAWQQRCGRGKLEEIRLGCAAARLSWHPCWIRICLGIQSLIQLGSVARLQDLHPCFSSGAQASLRRLPWSSCEGEGHPKLGAAARTGQDGEKSKQHASLLERVRSEVDWVEAGGAHPSSSLSQRFVSLNSVSTFTCHRKESRRWCRRRRLGDGGRRAQRLSTATERSHQTLPRQFPRLSEDNLALRRRPRLSSLPKESAVSLQSSQSPFSSSLSPAGLSTFTVLTYQKCICSNRSYVLEVLSPRHNCSSAQTKPNLIKTPTILNCSSNGTKGGGLKMLPQRIEAMQRGICQDDAAATMVMLHVFGYLHNRESVKDVEGTKALLLCNDFKSPS